jgi:hypothetical protein
VVRAGALNLPTVIAGLDPAIHEAAQTRSDVLTCSWRFVMDARIKSAHDAEGVATAEE